MAIFSRKSKAEKAEKAAAKAKGKQPPPEEKPAGEPYKHVPSHAASDAFAGNSAARDRQAEMERIMAASQQRIASNRSSTSLRSAHLSQVAAHTAMHGTPSPSSFAGQQQRRPFYGVNGRSPSQSAEVFTTDPDAPPMPSSSSQKHHSTTPRPVRNNSGYFSSSSTTAPSYDNASLGNPKMAAAARDRGYVGNPHNSADSGYGSAAASSAAHSRAPSEINAMQENGQITHLPQRGSSAFLPQGQMSLSEELAQEPAFSEHSFSDDQPLEMAPHPKPQEKERAMKRTTSYVSQLDPATDHTPARMMKQSKPSRSSMKQTRFVAPADPMSEYAQNQSAANSASSASQPEDGDTSSQATAHPQHSYSAPEPQPSEADAVLPNFDFEHPKPRYSQSQRTSSPARPTYTEPRPSFSRPMRTNTSTPPPAQIPKPETQKFAPSNPTPSAAPSAQYHDDESGQQHQYEHDASFRPLPQQTRAAQSEQAPASNPNRKRRTSTLPPLSILEGFKVNKKGRVLDEEGEPIGELAEGDIIDCVRQRVNGLGQVMDEYGSIVGQVKTLPRSMMSPTMQAATPAGGLNRATTQSQPQQYSQHHTMAPSVGSQGTDTLMHSQHQRPGQEQIAAPVPHVINRPAVYPLEFPDDVTRLELDGSTHAEAVPIMDHSEIFAPPFVPSRSPKRDRSPTIPAEQFSNVQEVTTPQPPGAFTTPAPGGEMNEHRPIRRWASRNFEDAQDVSEPVSNEEDEEPRAPSPIQYQQVEPPARSRTPPITQVRRSEDTQALRDLEGTTYQEPMSESLPQQSPALFAYKGDIPANDGPPPGVHVSAPRPPSMPQAPSFMRQGLTTNGPFSPPASVYTNSAPGMPAGRFNTMAPGPRPGLSAKNSLHMPMRKSPLSSSQSTPPESDDGNHDGTTVQTTSYSRPQSIRSTHSTTTNTKTRTYFTHSGRMTVDGSKPAAAKAPPTISEIPQPSSDAASTKSGKAAEKKRGRFSLSLGRKGSTVAAH